MGRLARETLELRPDSDSRFDDPEMVQTRPFRGLGESDISSVLRYNPWKYIMIAYRAHVNSKNSSTE